jgi:hypothetical protein
MAELDDKIACRTPAKGRDGITNIPAWKFDLLRRHILASLANGPRAYTDVVDHIATRLTADEADRLGKLGWHAITIKLEMEVRGEIERLNQKGPQHIRLTT